MKRTFQTIATALALALPGAAGAGEVSATVEVSGLWCASCPYIAAQAIQQVPSATITGGFYDPAAQMAQFEVTYDDAVVSLAELLAAPGEYGYPARQVEPAAADGNS